MSFTLPPTRQRTKALLDWYAAEARDLPWRHSRNPYAIWVSEIMLQQTQVATVIPRYHAWLRRFPTIETLAKSETDAVMKAWEGLGYYRRARMLHEAARIIVRQYGGRFPSDFTDILALPGIGRSTAGAIASFCFDAATPVLDGNVKRVLKRWHASPSASDKPLWLLAQQAIDDAGEPAGWNQAMMELGATRCGPKRADCKACPVAPFCASAFRADTTATAGKAAAVRDAHWLVHLHACPEKGLWLMRRPAPGIWAGLWAPPISELAAPPAQAPAHIHQLTHRRLHLYVDTVDTAPTGDGRWFVDPNQAAIPTGIRRLLAKQSVSS